MLNIFSKSNITDNTYGLSICQKLVFAGFYQVGEPVKCSFHVPYLLRLKIFDMIRNNTYHALHFREYLLAYHLPVD